MGVCNVTTGIVQRVPITIQAPASSWQSKISPDGQRIAYAGPSPVDIIVFDLSTSVSKSLTVPHINAVRVISWRDSGDSLLVVLSSIVHEGLRLRSTVALLEVANETLTELKQLEEEPSAVALSHDGRYLAFTKADNLYTADLVSGETNLSAIVEGSSTRKYLQAVLWTQKDDGLLFIAGRFYFGKIANDELRLMRVVDGRRVGELEVLPTTGVPFQLLGTSATGDVYYYAFPNLPLTVYIAPLTAAARQLGPPTAVFDLPSVPNMDWSPDSQSVVYPSWNPTKNVPRIVIRSIQTSVERRVDLPTAGEIWSLRWSPNAGLLVSSSDQVQPRLQLVSLEDMSVKPLQISARFGVAEWAADGWTALVAGDGNVREVEVTTGNVSQIYKVPLKAISKISPTQKLVASMDQVNGRFVVQVAGFDESTSRTLLSSGRPCIPAGFWKRQLFVACQDDSTARNSSPLYLVDVDSGTMKEVDVSLLGIKPVRVKPDDEPRIRRVRVSPDDQAIAITTGTTNYGSAFISKIPSK